MNSLNTRRRLVALAVIVVAFDVVGLPRAAQAMEPSTSTMVDSVTPTVPNDYKVSGATAYVGLSGCEKLADNNSKLSFLYKTNVDPTEQLSDGTRFKSASFFNVPRGSSATVDCTTANACSDIASSNIALTSDSVTVSIPFKTLTSIGSSTVCDQSTTDVEYFVRISMEQSSSNTAVDSADGRLIVDTIRPLPPLFKDVTATQNGLEVSWDPSTSTDVAHYVVFYSTTAFTGQVTPDKLASSVKSAVLTTSGTNKGKISVTLQPDSKLYVALAAQDEAGNYSILSAVDETTVIRTLDFWQDYKQAGGQEGGGYCSIEGVGPASTGGLEDLLALALAAGLVILVRRRRHV